jgi:hypothetical protein
VLRKRNVDRQLQICVLALNPIEVLTVDRSHRRASVFSENRKSLSGASVSAAAVCQT